MVGTFDQERDPAAMALGCEMGIVLELWKAVTRSGGEGENRCMREVEYTILRVWFPSSGPRRDRAAVEVQQERSQTAVKSIKDVFMVRDFSRVFWPVYFGRKGFNDAAKTKPFIMSAVEEETVTATSRAKVASTTERAGVRRNLR